MDLTRATDYHPSDPDPQMAPYADTVISPGACGPYRLEPLGDAEVKVLKSYVRA